MTLGSIASSTEPGLDIEINSFERLRNRARTMKLRDSFESGTPYQVDNMVRISDKSVTFGLSNCSYLLIHGKTLSSSGHFFPDNRNIMSKDIPNAFSTDASQIATGRKSLGALILGGHKDDNKSRDLYETLQTSVVATGITDPTVIWGAKTPITKTFYNEEGEIPTSWLSPPNLDHELRPHMHVLYDGTNKNKKKAYIAIEGWQDLLTLKAIAYIYDEVHFGSSGTVTAQGRTHPFAEANRIIKEYKASFEPDVIIPEEELNQGP